MQSADITELTQRLSKRPISILIAEDSESNQALLSLYFQKTTCSLDFVENGQQAVEKFMSNQYDIVLMDIFMPVMDGLNATRKIREYEKINALEPTPVIAVTASAFEEDRKNSTEAGCTGFLAKPIRKQDIFQCVASGVEGSVA